MNEQVDKVKEDVFRKFSLPKKPKTFGEEYEFPEDVSNLTSEKLGNWMFKIAAWKGYALKKLAAYELELSINEDDYQANMAMSMNAVLTEKKLVKEQLTGKVLTSNPEMLSKNQKLSILKSTVVSLKRLVEMYTMQLDIISRDISRRSIDVKLFQKGISD